MKKCSEDSQVTEQQRSRTCENTSVYVIISYWTSTIEFSASRKMVQFWLTYNLVLLVIIWVSIYPLDINYCEYRYIMLSIRKYKGSGYQVFRQDNFLTTMRMRNASNRKRNIFELHFHKCGRYVCDCVGSSETLYTVEKTDDEWITLECYKLGITMTLNYVKNTLAIKVSVLSVPCLG